MRPAHESRSPPAPLAAGHGRAAVPKVPSTSVTAPRRNIRSSSCRASRLWSRSGPGGVGS